MPQVTVHGTAISRASIKPAKHVLPAELVLSKTKPVKKRVQQSSKGLSAE